MRTFLVLAVDFSCGFCLAGRKPRVQLSDSQCCRCTGQAFDGMNTEVRKLIIGKTCGYVCRHPSPRFLANMKIKKVREIACEKEKDSETVIEESGVSAREPQSAESEEEAAPAPSEGAEIVPLQDAVSGGGDGE